MTGSPILLLKRGIRRGALTLRRESGYATTLGVLAGVAFLTQLLLLGGIGVEGAHRLLESRLDLRLQVVDGAPDRQVQEFLVALQDQPFTASVSYVTREQAYERERARNPELTSFLEEFDIQNPFPDTIAVSLRSLGDYDAFAAFARDSRWTPVVDPGFLSQASGQEQEVRQMLRVTAAGQALLGAFLILVAAVLLFVLIELVRRRAMVRREEILVERLFGAPVLSILVPFATEAALLLAASLAASVGLLALILWAAPLVVPALAPGGPFEPVRAQAVQLLAEYAPTLLGVQLLLIPVLSFGGAWLGMRPQMRGGRIALA